MIEGAALGMSPARARLSPINPGAVIVMIIIITRLGNEQVKNDPFECGQWHPRGLSVGRWRSALLLRKIGRRRRPLGFFHFISVTINFPHTINCGIKSSIRVDCNSLRNDSTLSQQKKERNLAAIGKVFFFFSFLLFCFSYSLRDKVVAIWSST